MPADQQPTGGSTTTSRTLTSPAPATSGSLRAAPRRRTVLAAAVAVPALAASGCSLRFGQPESTVTPAGPTADERARERAAADAAALAGLATRTARTVPSAASQLRTIADEHLAHAAALRLTAAATSGSPATTAPTSTPSATPSGAPESTASAGTARASLRALAARERAGITALEADLPAVSAELARVLASVAACRSVHVVTLGQLAARARA